MPGCIQWVLKRKKSGEAAPVAGVRAFSCAKRAHEEPHKGQAAHPVPESRHPRAAFDNDGTQDPGEEG